MKTNRNPNDYYKENSNKMMTTNESNDDDFVFDFDSAIEAIDLDEVPINAQSCLIMNQAYQQQLQQFIFSIRIRIEENRNRQKELQKKLQQDKTDRDNFPLSPKTLWSFRYPYFRDVQGNHPPPNADVVLKQRNGELNQNYVYNRLLWSDSNKVLLNQLVQQYTVKERIEKARCRKEQLLGEKEECENEPLQMKQIEDELRTLNNQIKKLIEEAKNEVTEGDPVHVDWLYVARLTDIDELNCRLYWRNCLSPSLNHCKWTTSEAERLRDLVGDESTLDRSAPDWEQIAVDLDTKRRPWQVCRQYQMSFNLNIRRNGQLTESEVSLLETVLNSCAIGDYINWQQIKYFFDGRSTAELRQYWARETYAQKRPVLSWSMLEDLTLLIAYRKYDSKWSDVAHYLPIRSARSCMDRFRRLLSFNPQLRMHLQLRLEPELKPPSTIDDERKNEMIAHLIHKCNQVTKDTQFLRSARNHFLKKGYSNSVTTEKSCLLRTWNKFKTTTHRKSRDPTEEQIDMEIAELFANYEMFPQKFEKRPCQKSPEQMFLDNRVMNKICLMLKATADERRFLGDAVLDYLFHHEITQSSDCESNIPPLFPPNRTTLNTFFSLLLIKESIGEIFSQYSVSLSNYFTVIIII